MAREASSVTRVAIVGAGGHAREVLEILLSERFFGREVEPIGFIDDDATSVAGSSGLPILGGLDRLHDLPSDIALIVAVGTPTVVRDLTARSEGAGRRFLGAVAPSALIAASATLGRGVIVFPNAMVSTHVRIGDHVSLNVGVSVSHDTEMGAFCGLGPGARVAGNVDLGEGCFVGMGANVLQGVTVGAWSVVGAGATVLEDVPAGVTVAGVPARVIGPAKEFPLARHRVADVAP
jgi:sugar O-acyltransferase (sialic acid O-acetyltransferase NeuD family)